MSPDLFGEPDPSDSLDSPSLEAADDAPLADRMRPRTLEEVVGQTQLLGDGHLLRRALEGELRQSLILWGPPGTGKTTLARLIAARSGLRFVPFSAVLSGIKEVRQVMTRARDDRRRGNRTLIFVDEIHRFNKAQQDAFLPFVESGDVLLIGATTQNPSFEVNSALLSRARAIMLEPLSPDELILLLRRALEDAERGLASAVEADDEILRAIAHGADGDARRALNLLETAAQLARGQGVIDSAVLKDALQRKTLAYDKSGDQHYDVISALHKSVRNSDPDASLYWLTRMMEAGEDGNYVARRLIRMAVEDVGLADPSALGAALDGAEAYRRLGSPEGDLALAQVAVLLARAEKSNELYRAMSQAREDIERTSAEPVPLHLRNAVTELMKSAGYGKGYRYAHDDPGAVGEMTCLPPLLEGRRYFGTSDPARKG